MCQRGCGQVCEGGHDYSGTISSEAWRLVRARWGDDDSDDVGDGDDDDVLVLMMMLDDGGGSCAAAEDDHNYHRHHLLGPITNSTYCHAIPQVRYYYDSRRFSGKELMLTTIVVVHTVF